VPGRSALLLLGAFVIALLLAGLAGSATAPGGNRFDFRRSTYLTGPYGTKGLADALELLGVPVARRQRSFFEFPRDEVSGETVALLDVVHLPTGVEVQHLADFVLAGGSLFLAGYNGVAPCFGFRAVLLDEPDSIAAPDGEELPPTEVVLDSTTAEDEAHATGGESEEAASCTAPSPQRIDTLLTTIAGEPVVMRLAFAGGGMVTMVGEPDYVSNDLLRRSSIGPLVIRWLVVPGTTRVVFDEYHQGFTRGQSIFVAAWGWARRSPAGWAMLQLIVAGLVGLLAAAVRFGPVRHVVDRTRRSSLEHVDALATGLERAGGAEAAVALIAGGLRRRMLRGGLPGPAARGDPRGWLGALQLSARTPEAHRAVTRLGALVEEHGGSERVLATATAVEDVWEALKPSNASDRS
jgi:hypothetical protein